MHNMRPWLKRKHLAVSFTAVLLCCVCADEGKEPVKAREGATVTLQPTSHLNNVQMVWTFGPKSPNMRIATVQKSGEVQSHYSQPFSDRLQLDSRTGALNITQLRVSDTGVYMWQSISSKVLYQHFQLTVYSSLSPPSITVNASLNNTGCSRVTVECSVDNSRELSLSWYRGGDRLKETSSPDLSSKLSLHLEIESHDAEVYTCVAKNPVEEKATKLHTEDTCMKNGETSSRCQTEATVRLVISSVVVMVLIVLVVDHIRLSR